MRHIGRPALSTQHLIFNLFGDYLAAPAQAVATAGLLEVLSLLGVGERAARSTLSRMKRRGWLEPRRIGRRSFYRLTPKARRLLLEGSRRLFGRQPEPWDGTWHLIAYSLPRERRLTRHRLRTRLSWLGYGMLQPGTLIAAYPRTLEVQRLLRELEVHPYVHLFAGAHLDPAEQDRVVERCWDLPAIDVRYAGFVEHYARLLRETRNRQQRDGGLPLSESFVARFQATSDYAEFPRIDPFLPDELLPRHWRGGVAMQLLAELRAMLQAPAEQYLRTTLLLGSRLPRRPSMDSGPTPGARKPAPESAFG